MNTLYGWQGPHAKLNIYSTSRHYWLVTPQVSISAPTVGSFYLALTDYNNNDPIEDASAQADDRFIVVMSTDNGVTWDQTNMAVWNDVTGDYGFSSIPTRGTRYSVNLSHYVGQNILIGFYGESTVSGGDNDLSSEERRVGKECGRTCRQLCCVCSRKWSIVTTYATSTPF